MALSLLQKLRIMLRGWARRREAAAEARRRGFIAREASWGARAKPVEVESTSTHDAKVDLDGLQVAWLDDSGKITYFLDRESGDVFECAPGSPQCAEWESEKRFFRIPGRTTASDASDREAYLATLTPAATEALRPFVKDAAAFREAVAKSRKAERSWYNFKTQRAIEAIERWLETISE